MNRFPLTKLHPPWRPSAGAMLWFAWMVGMWALYFLLLFTNRLDELWSAIHHFPLFVEVVLWVAFLPWMLGMAVWASAWADWLRVLLVVCFAAGWTIASLPRDR